MIGPNRHGRSGKCHSALLLGVILLGSLQFPLSGAEFEMWAEARRSLETPNRSWPEGRPLRNEHLRLEALPPATFTFEYAQQYNSPGLTSVAESPEATTVAWLQPSQSEASNERTSLSIQNQPGQNQPGQGEFGEEPIDNSLQFLRNRTVLLEPGDWQVDMGLAYLLSDTNFTAVDSSSNLIEVQSRRRQLIAPFNFRYGLNERIQLNASLPLTWSHVETATAGVLDINTNGFSIGDLRFGCSLLLDEGGAGFPGVVVSINGTAPTSEGPIPLFTNAATFDANVWAASAQILMIHRYDPVTVFWGTGYRHMFAADEGNRRIKLGRQFSYQMGVGFAANDRVTLSTALIGAFVGETEIDGLGVPGTQADPIRARFALTAFRNCLIVEPFFEVGLTQESPDAVLGVVWTY